MEFVGKLERQRITYFYERWRAVAGGVIEPFAATFFLLIAIKQYAAGDRVQALVATGGSIGMILGPLMVHAVRRSALPVNQAMAICHGLAALSLAVALFLPGLPFFVTGGLVALIFTMAAIPLGTQFYQQNYLKETRGGLFSVASTIRLAVAALVTYAIGELLTQEWIQQRFVIGLVAAAFAASAFLLLRCPGEPLGNHESRIPYQSLGLIFKDKAFGWLILIWMFMGIGNLMMLPLRIKMLVEPRYGFEYSEAITALLVGVIPAVTVFCTTWWWGRLFDRINFFVLRSVLNACFLLANLVFFLVGEMWGFVLGSMLMGLAFSGGNVAWSLWVTKLAPPDEVADYMSVHTFFTGVRAFVAPMISVPLAAVMPMGWLVTISTVLIGISILMLGPELSTLRRRRAGSPLQGDSPE